MSSLKQNKNFNNWLNVLFHGSLRKFNNFKRVHNNPSVYTDNQGLMVIATAQHLGININIVGTSNNAAAPYTVIEGEGTGDKPDLRVGYFQDTTDEIGTGKEVTIRAGHFQSLVGLTLNAK